MSSLHHFYLCIGSNIQPEIHLPKAVELLRKRGRILAVSAAWESHAVGVEGPNFLNACVAMAAPCPFASAAKHIIRPVESALGRRRTSDKNAPRTIDLDVVLYDQRPSRLEYWAHAFMIVPLAELLPEYVHPILHKELAQAAEDMRKHTWIRPRAEVLPGPKRQTEGPVRGEAGRLPG
ncbi:MAG: 2-amino-4-hydroxy-6-hydroxymethyldihydropteridine diphosphokinase [Chloroflexota bacterium]